jgi:hypothetical protein
MTCGNRAPHSPDVVHIFGGFLGIFESSLTTASRAKVSS